MSDTSGSHNGLTLSADTQLSHLIVTAGENLSLRCQEECVGTADSAANYLMIGQRFDHLWLIPCLSVTMAKLALVIAAPRHGFPLVCD